MVHSFRNTLKTIFSFRNKTTNGWNIFYAWSKNLFSIYRYWPFFTGFGPLRLQGVSKKKVLSWFSSYFSSRGPILHFHMCFGIKISSPFHIATQIIHIQNLNCPKNAKNACTDMVFIPASERKAWSVSSLQIEGQ